MTLMGWRGATAVVEQDGDLRDLDLRPVAAWFAPLAPIDRIHRIAFTENREGHRVMRMIVDPEVMLRAADAKRSRDQPLPSIELQGALLRLTGLGMHFPPVDERVGRLDWSVVWP